MSAPPSTRLPKLIEVLKQVASKGEECPSNDWLAERLHLSRASSAALLVKRAEEQGLIKVQRGHRSRIISCPKGTWTTAVIAQAPHWRDKKAASR